MKKNTAKPTITVIGKAITHQLHALSPNELQSEEIQMRKEIAYSVPKHSEITINSSPMVLSFTGRVNLEDKKFDGVGAMPRLSKLLRRGAAALGFYVLYEKILENEVNAAGGLPSHVAVILDGNRRWAREEGVPLEKGYEEGARRVEDFLKWCYDLGIKTVTLYALSTENIARRRREEIDLLLNIMRKYLERERRENELVKRKVRVKAIGWVELLPHDIATALKELELRTRAFNEKFLNIALAYGGRAEIVEAAKRVAEDVSKGIIKLESVDEQLFERYLQTAHLPNPYPDLVIRTSGELRVSNFLLWQIAYSELVFLDVYWPEFRRIDLLRAIRIYQARSRRFGA